MKIPQSVFDSQDVKWTQAAADCDGVVWLYTHGKIKPCNETGEWLAAGVGTVEMLQTGVNLFEQDAPREICVDWWHGLHVERTYATDQVSPTAAPLPAPAAPAAPMQHELPQSVFNNAPTWVNWAHVQNGTVYWSDSKPGTNPAKSEPVAPWNLTSPLAELGWGQVYIPTKRLQMTATALPTRQHGLPDPSVTTTKRTTVYLSDEQCEKLLRESILRHYPELAGGNLSINYGTDQVAGVTFTAEMPL